METASGQWVDLAWPDPTTINIDDIAHALAMQVRFNGHCSRFYSVAEHSWHCSKWLEAQGHNERIQLLGLLHDAAETYTGDFIYGVKQIVIDVVDVEHRIQVQIYKALGVALPSDDERHIVKLSDCVMLATEVPQLMSSAGGDARWNFKADKWEVASALGRWGPEEGEVSFLERYEQLRACVEA